MLYLNTTFFVIVYARFYFFINYKRSSPAKNDFYDIPKVMKLPGPDSSKISSEHTIYVRSIFNLGCVYYNNSLVHLSVKRTNMFHKFLQC